MLPNFLIVGPPKCASTSLHFYFSQHPEIFVPTLKETHFFTHDYEKGIGYYEKYFSSSHNAKAIGEATPAYCFLPFVCDRIKLHYPQIKLILCIRNPIERAFSHWLMLASRGVEQADFRTAMEINANQLSYIKFEGEAGARLWNDRSKHIEKGEKWPRIYLQPGMNAEIINRLQQQFGKDQLHYYFMDDLKNDFGNTLKKMFGFIQVDDLFQVPLTHEKNVYSDRKLNRLMNKLLGVKNTKIIGKLLSPSLKNLFRQTKQSKKETPRLQLSDRKFLWEIYKNDISELEQITKRDLSHWNPYKENLS